MARPSWSAPVLGRSNWLHSSHGKFRNPLPTPPGCGRDGCTPPTLKFNFGGAHPRTAPEASGRFVRSSAFTRQKVVNAPSRLKAELQTGAMCGCAPSEFKLKTSSEFPGLFRRLFPRNRVRCVAVKQAGTGVRRPHPSPVAINGRDDPAALRNRRSSFAWRGSMA